MSNRLLWMFTTPSHDSPNMYRSPNKRFVFRTQITEKNDKVIVKRTLFWYDSVKRTYRRKIELQTYDCMDDDFLLMWESNGEENATNIHQEFCDAIV